MRPSGVRPSSEDGGAQALGSPFPLRRRFRRQVLPALAVFVATLVAAMAWTSRDVLETVYLEQAARQARAIAEDAARTAPAAWNRLLSGEALADQDFRRLAETLEQERRAMHLSQLKVYDLTGRTLYAEVPERIGKQESNAALQEVLTEGDAGLRLERQADGSALYELYVPYRDGSGRLRAVFELYEPVDYLDAALLRAAAPAAAIPAAMLAALVLGLAWLVRRAQADIDRRTRLIDDLSLRLERFVSRRASDAIRGESDVAALPAENVDCTLLFSDIRGFTGYAEQHRPEEVIGMLNRAMRLQVAAIEAAGGDVDKMIGDAVFARFHGDGRAQAALAAAEEIQRAAVAEGLPLGIGIYSGPVITGVIGVGQRFDYTAVGDSVNVASRLCSAALAGETIVDRGTLERAGPGPAARYESAEPLSVKGRLAPIKVARRTEPAA